MYIRSYRLKNIIACMLTAIFIIGIISFISLHPLGQQPANSEASDPVKKDYIKWVDYTVPYEVMAKALDYDIKSHKTEAPLNWIETLAYLAAKYGGDFKHYKASDMETFVQRRKEGDTLEDITGGMKHFSYYYEAYHAILAQFVGEYQQEVKDGEGETITETRYGLKAFSPIAKGYSFSHYDDFGNGRDYGYKRKHLGNDLMGSIGTPIIAVESGVVEVAGWNMYGGWRIGIRSFDKKRYYYYAHLRKDRPFHPDMQEGSVVTAGQVIGYLGMTGYSQKENTNNINVPHLHFGLQLIFDESQKDGVNQIWIDVYEIVNLLQKHKSAVYKQADNNHFYAAAPIIDPAIP